MFNCFCGRNRNGRRGRLFFLGDSLGSEAYQSRDFEGGKGNKGFVVVLFAHNSKGSGGPGNGVMSGIDEDLPSSAFDSAIKRFGGGRWDDV